MAIGIHWPDAFSLMQTELGKRENSLLDNSQRLETVLTSMIEGVLSVDSNQVVLMANQAACEILELEKSALVGKKLFEVVRFPELCQAVVRTLESNGPSETEFQTMGIQRRTLEAQVTPLTYQGDYGAAIVIHDVTKIRNLENMRRDFVANVSHELKTPLASIKAYAETLRLGAIHDKENNLRFVEQIESQADVFDNQIRDLLLIAEVESGRTPFEIENVDVVHALKRCREQFAAAARKRKVDIRLVAEQSELFALVDRQALQTVLDNLVSNALRYAKPLRVTPARSGETDQESQENAMVRFVQLEADTQGDQVSVRVVDNGIGISNDDQARIFERFLSSG